MESKFALKSKAILGVLLALATGILPMLGIQFGADDSAMISGLWDKVLEVVFLGISVYGSFVRSTTLHIIPK